MIKYIGGPLRRGSAGAEFNARIATAFPRAQTIVTVPGIHTIQRHVFADQIDQQRALQGLPVLDKDERLALWEGAVDLIVEADRVLIRPNPGQMDLAFEADALLQDVASKRQIRFLFVSDPRVREAIYRRGEAWRIHPLPRSPDEIKQMISSARNAVAGLPIYYYNAVLGSRVLTCDRYSRLAALDDDALRGHLLEIAELSRRRNTRGHPELDLFMTQDRLSADELSQADLVNLEAPQVRAYHERMCRRFEGAVDPAFRRDDPDDLAWRNRMYASLIGRTDDQLSESDLLGLSSEFFMQIEWLPGARIEAGELLFDSVEDESAPGDPPDPADTTVRGLICNLMQELSDLECINIGRVAVSLSRRLAFAGRREVYVAHFRQRGVAEDSLQVIRMQKWGVRERLDEGKDLLRAMIESEEYTDYIMDRRLGCRQLGMNLPPRVWTRKVAERYAGRQESLAGVTIWSPYFQRDFIAGFATDKLPSVKLEDARYADALAALLGEAAASNTILGRCDIDGQVTFDDGDEVVVEDSAGTPLAIIVADHTGTFRDCQGDLLRTAPDYAEPVNRRIGLLADPASFAGRYVEGFLTRFRQIQAEYIARRRAFDSLFRHRRRDPAGNLAWRWQQVLARLEQARPEELADAIKAHIEAA